MLRLDIVLHIAFDRSWHSSRLSSAAGLTGGDVLERNNLYGSNGVAVVNANSTVLVTCSDRNLVLLSNCAVAPHDVA